MVRHCPRSQPFLPVGANIATTRAMILFSRDHKCINPESRRGGRSESVPDLNINANARPDGPFRIPKGAEAYFTLDKNVCRRLSGILISFISFPRAILRATISSSKTTTRWPRMRGGLRTSWKLTNFLSLPFYTYNRINWI